MTTLVDTQNIARSFSSTKNYIQFDFFPKKRDIFCAVIKVCESSVPPRGYDISPSFIAAIIAIDETGRPGGDLRFLPTPASTADGPAGGAASPATLCPVVICERNIRLGQECVAETSAPARSPHRPPQLGRNLFAFSRGLKQRAPPKQRASFILASLRVRNGASGLLRSAGA